MGPKEIKDLLELISRSNFASFELERDGFKLKLVKDGSAVRSVVPIAPEPLAVAARPATAIESSPDSPPDGLFEFKSPIVGTFYRGPSPEAPAFVESGASVSKGQVLCIVEAMKVMNEIESEIDGEVVEVLVANAQPVEFGEVLFRLRPVG